MDTEIKRVSGKERLSERERQSEEHQYDQHYLPLHIHLYM